MFLGGGIGSLVGTGIYDRFGWQGTAWTLICSCLTLTALSALSLHVWGAHAKARPAVQHR
jgi:hypothetical protein